MTRIRSYRARHNYKEDCKTPSPQKRRIILAFNLSTSVR